MLSRNATLSVLLASGTGEPTNAPRSTRLPSATNSSIAAAVAQVVMMWLLAMRTVLLRHLVSALFRPGSGVLVAERSENNPTRP